MNRPRSIALVDLSYIFKKRYVTSDTGTPLAAAKATLQDLENLRRGVGHVILCRDAPPYNRAALFADYKAKRPKPEPEETYQRKWLFGEVTRLGFNVAWSEGYEADDVAATLAKAYDWCDDVRLVTSDKDAAQCITDTVLQYIPPIGNKDWNVRTREGVIEKFGVTPEQIPLYLALAGDKGDGIPGAPGIGEMRARELVKKYQTPAGLAKAMADAAAVGSQSPTVKSVLGNWDKVCLYLRLVTLDTNVPVDPEALLVKREPEPEQRAHNDMADVSLDGYVPNETPSPNAVGDALYEQATKVYEGQFMSANDKSPGSQTTAAKDAELLEAEYDNERATQGETDPVRADPGDKAAAPPPRQTVSREQRTEGTTALVKQAVKYGLVDQSLQPLDLQAAYTVSEWIVKSKLYPKFNTPSQVFVVIARGKELGVGMIASLENTHMIDGKPVSHSDLIRGLAERDKSFEYLYPTKQSDTSCTWVGRRKGMPEGAFVEYTYTIEDAARAGLVRLGNYAGKSNWDKRPQDMLTKTAASKLARQLWAAATMGLYCPEEFGYTDEELDERDRSREAA